MHVEIKRYHLLYIIDASFILNYFAVTSNLSFLEMFLLSHAQLEKWRKLATGLSIWPVVNDGNKNYGKR